jgi:glyceraldehyde-3-phosphate dehydrogenase (NADP+)
VSSPTALADTLHPLVAGESITGTGERFVVNDPYRKIPVEVVQGAGPDELERAMASAREGARQMAALPSHDRSRLLLEAASILRSRADEIAEQISREVGKALKDARREAGRAAITLEVSAQAALTVATRSLSADASAGGEGLRASEVRVPVGVVAAISPFNSPLNLAAHKLGPALAAGNAAILKPSSRAPQAGLFLAEVLLKAGIPAAALSVLPGDRQLALSLAGHPQTDFVSFTGGRWAGEQIRRAAGMRPLIMELGGNNAVLVHRDADLTRAARLLTWGAFANAGQSCNSAQRIYVHEAAFDAFLEAFLAEIEQLKVGDPIDPATDVGSMVSEAEAERLENLVEDVGAHGARVLTGGRRERAVFWPTVLADVADSAPIACDEAFGPVVLVDRYRSLEEAIERANATDYGLVAAVFTRSLSVTEIASRRLRVGTVNINRPPNYRLDHLPYGGVRGSGLGERRTVLRRGADERAAPDPCRLGCRGRVTG